MAIKPFRAALLAFALVLPGAAYAADATIDQVYAEAKSGDVQGALTMMAPVLKDHPDSARAHYVEAELLAHAHRPGDARTELTKAETMAPGLPGINAGSVSRLKAEINGSAGLMAAPGVAPPSSGGGISTGFIIVLALVVFGFLALMRRRPQPQNGPGVMPGQMGAPMGGMPGAGYGPGYGGGMMGGGSGIMGSVGRGLGMGAGFAVGEEVVDHLFGGHSGGGLGGVGGGQGVDPNADMGGQDFGISDSGSWDDGGGGGDGGGDGGGGGW